MNPIKATIFGGLAGLGAALLMASAIGKTYTFQETFALLLFFMLVAAIATLRGK